LCSRAERCQFGPDVPFRVRREFRQSLIDLSRHLGDYQTSLDLAEEGRRLAGTAKASSYEDRVQADLDYAAALFAPHRFQDIHDLLDPWRVKLTADPLLVTPILRTKVFNTLGRALAAVGRDGWEELFCCAAQIMEEIEPTDLPRTLIYLAQSYLRNGQLTNATAVLARIEDDPSLDETSRWFLCNVQADAARRRGEIWVDPEMEQAEVSRRVGHPFAYYFQATARQPGRDTADSLGRFRRAREFFGQDLPGRDARNIQCFLIACIELAEAAWASDQDGWNESLSRLQRHVAPTPGLALSEHYNGYLPAPGSTPTQKAAERLLSRVPFF
jgi:hypothetical protein